MMAFQEGGYLVSPEPEDRGWSKGKLSEAVGPSTEYIVPKY